MATLREYFDVDFGRVLHSNKQLSFFEPTTETEGVIEVATYFDFEAFARFTALFFENGLPVRKVVEQIIWKPDIAIGMDHVVNVTLPSFPRDGMTFTVRKTENSAQIESQDPGEPPIISSELPFTRRVFIYSESELSIQDRHELRMMGRVYNIELWFRDSFYAQARNQQMKPKAFISHDSRDKADIAKPIAVALSKLHCPIWYDEYSLEVGDSLRESIEKGLKECHRCILVLTPNFLNKGGWPKREYETAYTRELVEDTKLFLPVWSGVTRDDVYEYSPILADRVALDWGKLGEEEVVRRLFHVLNK